MPVAPRAGAWIETIVTGRAVWDFLVAPRAGAWIETSNFVLVVPITIVAPRAGAWIETGYIKKEKVVEKSLPARERGLKHTSQTQ